MSELNPFVVAGVLLVLFLIGIFVGAALFSIATMLARRRERMRWLGEFDREAKGSPDPRYDPKQFRRR